MPRGGKTNMKTVRKTQVNSVDSSAINSSKGGKTNKKTFRNTKRKLCRFQCNEIRRKNKHEKSQKTPVICVAFNEIR